MKRVILWVLAILVVVAGLLAWRQRDAFTSVRDLLPTGEGNGFLQRQTTKPLDWKPVEDAALGFKVEMPGEPQRVVVQATSETGGQEPVQMLLVKPEADRTYAVAWAEKPPVARVNDLVPDKTLDSARDGALTRTGTTLVTESRTSPQGFAGRDVVARNAGGGVLDTRFVYAKQRLYMLIAASPSKVARQERDVNHFFNSFELSGTAAIPESLPAAVQER